MTPRQVAYRIQTMGHHHAANVALFFVTFSTLSAKRHKLDKQTMTR